MPPAVQSPSSETDAAASRVDLVIFEPGFCSLSGHHAPYIAAIVEQAGFRHLSTCCAVPADCSAELIDWLRRLGCEVKPCSYWARFVKSPSRAVNWTLGSLVLALDIARLGHGQGSPRVIYLPSGLPDNVLGAVVGAALCPQDCHVMIQLMAWERSEARRHSALLTRALRRISESVLSRNKLANLSIVTDHQLVTEKLFAATGRNFSTLPMCIRWDKFQEPARSKRRQPVLGFLGQARAEKGFYQLVEAIALLPSNWQFVVQATHPFPDQALHDAIAYLSSCHHVKVIVSDVSESEYASMFDEIDILIMPYSPEHYANRSSCVLVEAAGNAKVVVVPADTALASGLGSSHAGVSYAPYDAQALARAVRSAVSKWSELQEMALDIAMTCRNTHNSASLLNQIWQTAIPDSTFPGVDMTSRGASEFG